MHPAAATPLTPLSFLARAAEVFPDSPAVAYGDTRWTYRDLADHATRVARGLQAIGVKPGDRVAYLCPNLPELLAAHFAVPLAGAVLVAVNTRLAPKEVQYILEHSGARVLVVDAGLHGSVAPVADQLGSMQIITLVDPYAESEPDDSIDALAYDDLLQKGSDEALPWAVDDEWATISINYTSGTTGKPKGVKYTHRGAYLNALGEIIHSRHTPASVYLWTLPMFHCNGWCTTWAVVAAGGTNVCLRAVEGEEIWRLLDAEAVTHLNGAPTVLVTIANAPEAHPLEREVVVTTAGAAPSPSVIARVTELGAQIVHVYGLTETYGPYSICEEQRSWADLDDEARSQRLSRQGVGMVQTDGLRVITEEWEGDSVDLVDVPADGETMGEIVMRGNNVMSGYFDDEPATEEAFRGGWFHSGDLGVMHPDGYVELRDREKDIIVSGGENISTVEVERAIDSHQAVLEAAVVSVPSEKWGERPKAFVVLVEGEDVSADDLVAHVRDQLAGFKAPEEIEFVSELPKTSTGKVQKFALRDEARGGGGSDDSDSDS